MWQEKFEAMSADEMQAFQQEKLRETVAWVYERVPFYRKKFDDVGMAPGDVKRLEDLGKLTFTVKTDLRDNYPMGLCALPQTEIARVHASSGTTGKPIIGPYTRADLEQWSDCVARNMAAAGVTKSDVCQVSFGMGLFTGGLGFFQGCERMGCTQIPASSGMTERQITLMRDLKATALCCTPSYALTIADKASDLGVDLRALPLKIGIFGAEPWTQEMRREIEDRMGITAREAYGLTELMGPGVAFDCDAQDGWLHVNEDHVLAEIIDPVTEEVLPLGEKGELVLTAIQRRAMPLVRYRTRDITQLKREKCSCGRTLLKMKKVYGRSDDMLIISGVNVFPSQIEALLLETPEVEPQYVLIIRKKGYLDALSVDVEAKAAVYDQGEEKLKAVEAKIESRIRGVVGIGVKVRCVPPKSIERSEGKAKRVFDARKL